MRSMMSFRVSSMLTVFVLLSICAASLANAGQLIFSKVGGKIYVETGPKHYAMFGQFRDENGVRIIAVNEGSLYSLTSKCVKSWSPIEEVQRRYLRRYREIRKAFLGVNQWSPEASSLATESYRYSTTLSSDQEEYSSIKLDDNTLILSSKYFPSELARVIISGKVIIFVHHDGRVTMKTIDCLYLNEQKLFVGINKLINIIDDDNKLSLNKTNDDDKTIKEYFEANPINESEFSLEQMYSKTYTNEELLAMNYGIKRKFRQELNKEELSKRNKVIT